MSRSRTGPGARRQASVNTGRIVYLENLYVVSEFRGRGIGKKLLSEMAKSQPPKSPPPCGDPPLSVAAGGAGPGLQRDEVHGGGVEQPGPGVVPAPRGPGQDGGERLALLRAGGRGPAQAGRGRTVIRGHGEPGWGHGAKPAGALRAPWSPASAPHSPPSLLPSHTALQPSFHPTQPSIPPSIPHSPPSIHPSFHPP
ncbi:uncharacterized protein [Lepidochelys kempii]|uniref:uncharacterized protein isoform X2 n=1 Tax=Lepidochelys kempii TaxID=8472 RepID=UPI003C6FA2E8